MVRSQMLDAVCKGKLVECGAAYFELINDIADETGQTHEAGFSLKGRRASVVAATKQPNEPIQLPGRISEHQRQLMLSRRRRAKRVNSTGICARRICTRRNLHPAYFERLSAPVLAGRKIRCKSGC